MNKISKKFKISKEYYLENIYLRGPGDILNLSKEAKFNLDFEWIQFLFITKFKRLNQLGYQKGAQNKCSYNPLFFNILILFIYVFF